MSQVSGGLGLLGTAASGAALGATLGSIIPGLGTAVGAIAGAGLSLAFNYKDTIKDAKSLIGMKVQQANTDLKGQKNDIKQIVSASDERIDAIKAINGLLDIQNKLISSQSSILQSMSSGLRIGIFNPQQIEKQAKQSQESLRRGGVLLLRQQEYLQAQLQQARKNARQGHRNEATDQSVIVATAALNENRAKGINLQKQIVEQYFSGYEAVKATASAFESLSSAQSSLSSKAGQFAIKFGLPKQIIQAQSKLELDTNKKTQEQKKKQIQAGESAIANLRNQQITKGIDNSILINEKQTEIKATKTQVLELQMQEVIASQRVLNYSKERVGLAKTELDANKGLLDALIAQAAAGGKGSGSSQAQISVALSSLRLQKQRLIEQKKQDQLLLDQQSNKQSGNAVQYRSEIAKAEAESAVKDNEQFEIRNKILNVNSKILEGQKLNISYAQGLVSLANNFATGIGASAQLQMNVVSSLRDEAGTLEDQMTKAVNNLNQATTNQSVISYENEIKKIRQEQLQNIQAQVDATKSLREGWISAVSASSNGQGRITKIMIDQKQNLAAGLQFMGIVRSYASGALARPGEGSSIGKAQGAQFSQYGGFTGNTGASYTSDIDKALGLNMGQLANQVQFGGKGAIEDAVKRQLAGAPLGGGFLGGINASNMNQLTVPGAAFETSKNGQGLTLQQKSYNLQLLQYNQQRKTSQIIQDTGKTNIEDRRRILVQKEKATTISVNQRKQLNDLGHNSSTSSSINKKYKYGPEGQKIYEDQAGYETAAGLGYYESSSQNQSGYKMPIDTSKISNNNTKNPYKFNTAAAISGQTSAFQMDFRSDYDKIGSPQANIGGQLVTVQRQVGETELQKFTRKQKQANQNAIRLKQEAITAKEKSTQAGLQQDLSVYGLSQYGKTRNGANFPSFSVQAQGIHDVTAAPYIPDQNGFLPGGKIPPQNEWGSKPSHTFNITIQGNADKDIMQNAILDALNKAGQ